MTSAGRAASKLCVTVTVRRSAAQAAEVAAKKSGNKKRREFIRREIS
jgi:hypothetical protein